MKNKSLILAFWAILALLIKLFSLNSFWVENRYSTGFYPGLSKILRFLFGWLPFSIGDLLYGVVFLWLIWRLIKFGVAVKRKRLNKEKLSKQRLQTGAYKFTVGVLVIYCVFNILWGINYNRKGIAYQLGLSKEKYTTDQLRMIDSVLLQKVNESKIALLTKNQIDNNSQQIFTEAVNAYKELGKKYPFLDYRGTAVKKSMWGWLGNYIGFTGYYNPFTGEANINTTVPAFLQPFTTCHEIGHQLGYAKENEANFVGYLAASASKDTSFHYSVYLDLFMYANRTLYNVDSGAAKNFSKQLLPEIKADMKEWKLFLLKHKNPVEPGIRWMYGKFLESNEQPSGVLSYDEVTALLIAYYKKYRRI